QQARGVRGLPERNPSFGGPRPTSAAHRRRHPRLRGTVARARVAVGLTFMATHPKAAARRASRSPLVINISRLGRRPGAMVTLSETVARPSRVRPDLIGIDEGAPLKLDLRIESVSEGVLVSGTVWAPTSGECARCLTPFTGDVEIALTELFAYPDSATDETTESDELGRVVDDTVDLEQPIIDAIGFALPLS